MMYFLITAMKAAIHLEKLFLELIHEGFSDIYAKTLKIQMLIL